MLKRNYCWLFIIVVRYKEVYLRTFIKFLPKFASDFSQLLRKIHRYQIRGGPTKHDSSKTNERSSLIFEIFSLFVFNLLLLIKNMVCLFCCVLSILAEIIQSLPYHIGLSQRYIILEEPGVF